MTMRVLSLLLLLVGASAFGMYIQSTNVGVESSFDATSASSHQKFKLMSFFVAGGDT
jgi:hypothetical protein